jgi:hypothetical protein
MHPKNYPLSWKTAVFVGVGLLEQILAKVAALEKINARLL